MRPWNGQPLPIKQLNLKTGNRYSGVNFLNLLLAAEERGFSTNYWVTAKQCQELGGAVKKGEHGTPILWAANMGAGLLCDNCGHSFAERNSKTRKRNTQCPKCGCARLLSDLENRTAWRFYKVFNVEQCEGLNYPAAPAPRPTNPLETVPEAEQLLDGSGARIRYGSDRAFYNPAADSIRLPHRGDFTSTHGFYSTALHELAHWTGHESRLNREFGKRFGDLGYAMEELVAEMASAYLCGHAGISAELDNHASYIEHWLKIAQEKPGAIIEACSKASKVLDYLVGLAEQQPVTTGDVTEFQLTLEGLAA